MKKLIAILTLITLIALTGCDKKPQPTPPEATAPVSIPAESGQPTESVGEANNSEEDSTVAEQINYDAFSDIYTIYLQAIEERWGGDRLIENGMSLMMIDCYGEGNIGYTYDDLDKDGRGEFIVALTDAFTDDFYSKIVLDIYSLDDNGELTQVFSSGDRNRLYYAGDNLFANVGSSGVGYELNTTLKLQGTELIDTTTITDPSLYQQLTLNIFS